MSDNFQITGLIANSPQAIISKVSGTWGIFVQSVTHQSPMLIINADEIFPAASVIKIPILITLYQQIVANNLDLRQRLDVEDKFRTNGSGILNSLSDQVTLTVKDLAILMMQLSDNTAANILIALLSKDKINETMGQLGLQQTKLELDRIDPALMNVSPNLVTTTPSEISTLLLHLARRDILTLPTCQEILDIMKRNLNKQRLCGQLPFRSDLIIHHKTGTLTGVYHDVGLVRFARGEYVISILTKNAVGSEDPRLPNGTEQIMAQISRWVFDYLDQMQ